MHFADPVPEGTYIPALATAEPPLGVPANSYGWNDGILNRLTTPVLKPAATEAYWLMHKLNSSSIEGFSEDNPPMVTNIMLDPGDSGGGTFSPWNVLTGIHVSEVAFQFRLQDGSIRIVAAALEQPVWRYRSWILAVTSAPPPPRRTPPGGPALAGRRRRLPDTTAAAPGALLQMTLPPQTGRCDPGMPSCTGSDPVWARGVLLGTGNYRGTALARCAPTGTNSCSFDGAGYAAGASARMLLGPLAAPGSPGTRAVMIWCKTSVAFPDELPGPAGAPGELHQRRSPGRRTRVWMVGRHPGPGRHRQRAGPGGHHLARHLLIPPG